MGLPQTQTKGNVWMLSGLRLEWAAVGRLISFLCFLLLLLALPPLACYRSANRSDQREPDWLGRPRWLKQTSSPESVRRLQPQQQCIAEVKELFGQVREGTLSLDDLEEQVLALIEGVHERERALVAENQTLVSKATAYDDMRKEMQKIFELSTT
ncbi:Glycoside hydrolase family 53 domain protein [Rhodotorula toruloides ATCC 204091]|uniref:Glycoside hydrolase family 53 domain protein n=1 Tax=Rhodotorula toruloides TaxID=5286 RepID=A0A2S9ZZ32_RHOTO|nr:Glycoside hydrolase family 53 domain protein [Rhodotorula toruloides ATCC 204091]PRQ71026.1 glycoside hydrolase family 53 domain protein [Rhodotorula toruloides]